MRKSGPIIAALLTIAQAACSLALGGTGAPLDAGVDGPREHDASALDSAPPHDAHAEASPEAGCIGCVVTSGACIPIGMPCETPGSVCTPGGTCVSCGAQGQACCNTNPPCASACGCQDGTCVENGSNCDPTDLCVSGACMPCGRPGGVCCAASSCASGCCDPGSGACVSEGMACNGGGGVCASGSCVACGASKQPCCAGGSCNPGCNCGGQGQCNGGC